MAGGIENLKTLSPDEAREYGRIGGIASGEARREKKRLRDALEELLSMPCEAPDGTEYETGTEAVATAIFSKAMAGNLRAFEIIRDTTEGRPPIRAEVVHDEISPETYAEVEALLFGDMEVQDEQL